MLWRTQREIAIIIMIAAVPVLGVGQAAQALGAGGADSSAWETATTVEPDGATPAPTSPPPVSETPAPSQTPVPSQAPASSEEPGPTDGAPAPESTDPPATAPATDGSTQPDAPALSARAAPQTLIEAFPPGTHRLAGNDRFETAVAISKRFAPGVPVVYMATAVDFPDALSAASAAAALGGPLLLVNPDSVPETVRAELVRLAPAKIVVAGGEAVISPAVLATLQPLAPVVSRVGGEDRYATGERLVSDAFGGSAEVYVATGWSFPDALAASAAAGANAAPVVLIDGLSGSIRASTLALLRTLGAADVRIAGGPAAISTELESQLVAAGFRVTRYEGRDRFLTAAAINEAAFSPVEVDDVYLATGIDFADALAGSVLAGATGSPLYLAYPDCIPAPAAASMGRFSADTRVLLGGTDAIGEAVASGVECQIIWAKPASGRITDGFGPRAPICTPEGCTQSVHRGVDLGTGCWAPIYAAAAGRVVTSGRVGTYGNFIKLKHGDIIDTGYAHIVDGGLLVGVGDYVAAGQQIAWSGATGAATGCHLHFEVYRSGTQIDPVPFMAEQGVKLG